MGPQVFARITKKGGEIVALITYQVSSDGQTLTARTSGPIDQTVVFKRRELSITDSSPSRSRLGS